MVKSCEHTASMSDRVARRRAQTRERIFTEAMRLFAERGFDRVTVADITEAADVGKGTFFTHFPSKRDVFRYLGEQVSEVMADAAAKEGTAVERLHRVMRAAGQWLEAHPEPARQMAKARAFTLSDLGSANQQRLQRALAEILTEGQKRGELREVPIADAVMALQCNYFACVLLWAADPGGRPLTDRLRASLDITLNGLT